MYSASRELYRDRLYVCILALVCPSCLLLLAYLDHVRCIYKCVRLRSSYADVVGGLLVISSLHFSELVYFCYKLVIVVAIA